MAYFKQLDEQLKQLTSLLHKDQRWLIMMNADPDALASAMALKRIINRRVESVGIAQVNEVKRPDNLAMIHYLRIPTRKLIPNLAAQYDKFALVDSQPHHHTDFKNFDFSIVIDHHPISKENPVEADFVDVRPKYGSCSSMLTEYLYNMKIKPARLLATALFYGIKTDTSSFERDFVEADISAFKYLNRFADKALLKRIMKSEFHLDWVRYFSKAFYNMRRMGKGAAAHMGKVESPDILVIVADFFMRVHEVPWNVISGEYDDQLVVIFRGDGLRKDMGKFAQQLFSEIGSAGGHRGAARAEIPIENIGEEDPEIFMLKKLGRGKTRFKRI